MYKVVQLGSLEDKQNGRETEIEVHYENASLWVGRGKQRIQKVEMKSRILSVSISQHIFVLLKNCVEILDYLSEDEQLHMLRSVNMQDMVHGVLSAHFLGGHMYQREEVVNFLYDLNHQRKLVLPSKDPGADRIISIKAQTPSRLEIGYLHKHQVLEWTHPTYKILEEKARTHHSRAHRTIFLNKSTVIQIKDTQVKQKKISTYSEILSGKAVSILEHKDRKIVLKTEKGEWSIYIGLEAVEISKQAGSKSKENTPEAEAEQSSNSKDEASAPGKKMHYRDGHVYVQNRLFARFLTQPLFVSCTETHIHQLYPDGTIKVFVVEKKLKLAKSLHCSTVQDLKGFWAISSPSITVVVLSYHNKFRIVRYANRVSTVEETPISDNILNNILSIVQHPGAALVQYTDRWAQICLENSRVRFKPIAAPPGTQSLTLQARKPGTPLQVVSVIKKENMYIGHASGKELVQDRNIRHLHILHTGYVYSREFAVVFSNGEVLDFSFRVSLIRVLNGPSGASSVLIQLEHGQTYLLRIEKDRIERKTELFQRICPDQIELLALDSFIVFSGFTVTIFSEKRYIYPAFRTDFPSQPLRHFLSEDTLHIATEQAVYALLPATASSLHTSAPGSIGAFFE
ncbi:hypothetical protein NECID01_1410 [Nematocida sp. AWRm77]|nr:hypothetical protein NECID01_1410 [Nematocida sp. AWRm77]